jgi:hypothetical protein
MNYIVIPEGLAGDGRGRPLGAPSFVYRQVLDYVLERYAEGDTVYLAPANTYDGKTEHELAFRYLKAKNSGCHVRVPSATYEKYVDTRDNARLLRAFLGEAYREIPFVLICAALHSYRTEYCFKSEGFRLEGMHRVAYTITGEAIARRWWYYRHRSLHVLYEGLAFCRDLFKGTFLRRPHAEKK